MMERLEAELNVDSGTESLPEQSEQSQQKPKSYSKSEEARDIIYIIDKKIMVLMHVIYRRSRKMVATHSSVQ